MFTWPPKSAVGTFESELTEKRGLRPQTQENENDGKYLRVDSVRTIVNESEVLLTRKL